MLVVTRSLTVLGIVFAAAYAHGVGTLLSLLATSDKDAQQFYSNTPALSTSKGIVASGVHSSSSASASVGMGEIHTLSMADAVPNSGMPVRAKTLLRALATDEARPLGAFPKQRILVRYFLPVTGTGLMSGEGLLDATFSFFTQSFDDNQGLTYRQQISNGTVTYDGYYGGYTQVDVTYESGQTYVMDVEYNGTIDLVGTNVASTGKLDFANTAHLYAQVLTPGATLSFASGHDYAAPVPEPASFAALGAGLFGAAAARRRRNGRAV